MKNKYCSLVLLLMASLVTNLGNAQGTAELSGTPITIQTDEMGYNCQNYFGGPKWTDSIYRHTSTRLRPGNLRYPGGTIANFWDWRTGTIIETKTSGFPNYQGDEFAYTPEVFVEGIPKDAEIIYVVNMARPTPSTGVNINAAESILNSKETLELKINDILEGIQAFTDAGHPLKYIELGNEFYNGANGAPNSSGAIYSGRVEKYIVDANTLADSINRRFPQAELAVIGDSFNENRDDIDDSGDQNSEWTAAIYKAIEEDRLKNIDAITFHWYTGPGVPLLDNDDAVERSLNQPFKKQRAVERSDFGNNRLGLDIWVTEYNTFSQPRNSNNPNNPGQGGAIQGSWTNGMFGASMTVLYSMLGPNVTKLNIHALTKNNAQWAMLVDKDTLSGNGVAMGLVGKAMTGMTKASNIDFTGIANPTFGQDGDPSLYGVKFSNDTKESIIVFNNTRSARNGVDIASVFTGSANKRRTTYYDTTPYVPNRLMPAASFVDEDEGLEYIYNDDQLNTVDFPPFSITVIEQEKSNVVVNGSFETSGGFSKGNLKETNIRNARTGNKSLKLNTTSQSFSGSTQTVNVQDNKTYVFKADIRTELTAGAARIKLDFIDDPGNTISSMFELSIGGSNSYKTYSFAFDTPDKGNRVKITLQLANGLGTVWFDDVAVILEEGTLSTPSFLKNDDTGFIIYPNPAINGTFTLQLNDANAFPDTIEIKDIVGKTVKSIKNPSSKNVKIEGLSKGLYIVTAAFAGKKYSKKLIID